MEEDTELNDREEKLRMQKLEKMMEEDELQREREKIEEIKRKERNGYDWPDID